MAKTHNTNHFPFCTLHKQIFAYILRITAAFMRFNSITPLTYFPSIFVCPLHSPLSTMTFVEHERSEIKTFNNKDQIKASKHEPSSYVITRNDN